MKKLIVALVVSIQSLFSHIEKQVGLFNKVTVFDKIDVLLMQSDEDKVVLNGDGFEDIEIINKNGELKIRTPLLKMLSGDNISATVYLKNLNAIEANEGSKISCEDALEATSFDIIAKEGAKIKVRINVSRLNIKISSGVSATIFGKASTQEVLVGSGAVYRANNLITTQTIITANAGAEGDVFATELVDAKVRAGGAITIYGNPKQINKKIIAGGQIKKHNETDILKGEN